MAVHLPHLDTPKNDYEDHSSDDHFRGLGFALVKSGGPMSHSGGVQPWTPRQNRHPDHLLSHRLHNGVRWPSTHGSAGTQTFA